MGRGGNMKTSSIEQLALPYPGHRAGNSAGQGGGGSARSTAAPLESSLRRVGDPMIERENRLR